MKLLKIRNLLMLLAMSGMFTFTSCSDDDSSPDPTLNFIGDTTTISPGDNATLKSGEMARFSWNVSNGGSDLTRFTIDYVPPGGSSTEIFRKTNLQDNNATEYSGIFDTTLVKTGEHNFTFRIEEENGNSSERSIAVQVEASNQVQTFQQTLLAAPQGNETSETFYASSDNSTYTKEEADNDGNIQAKIDFGYRYSPASGDDDGAILVNTTNYPSSVYDLSDWTNKKNTQFATTSVSVNEFDNIAGSDDAIVNASDPSSNSVKNLNVDDVIAFETDGGKKGLLKVVSITPGFGSNGEIKFQVKIQK